VALGAAPLRATARAGHLRVTDFGWLELAETVLVIQTGSTTLAWAAAGIAAVVRAASAAASWIRRVADRPFTSSEPNIGPGMARTKNSPGGGAVA
jgi:hypothetical protein